jgi:hypothetical protein
MPPPSRKIRREETRTAEEIRFITALNSGSTTMIPMVDAAYVRVRNPITGLDLHCKTDSDSFQELIKQLCDKGLRAKLDKEFDEFALKYDSKWALVKQFAMPSVVETQ